MGRLGIFDSQKSDEWYEGLKDVYVPVWDARSAEKLIKLDMHGEGEQSRTIFLDRARGGFLIARNCQYRKRTDGWETCIELVSEDREHFDGAKEAFSRWLEILG